MESNLLFEDIKNERNMRKEYHDSLLKELNRRDTIFGKKIQKSNKNEEGGNSNRSNDNKGDKNQNQSDDESSVQVKTQKDIFKLKLPKQFPKNIKAEQLEDELKRLESREPAYVKQMEYNQVLQNKRDMLMHYTFTMKQKYKIYKKSTKNLPKDPAGIYILLDGLFTVKNDFNQENPISGKPVELYPKIAVEKSPVKEKQGQKSFKMEGQKNQENYGDRPEYMDIVGAEKFLQVQGYTYYGCLYAADIKKKDGEALQKSVSGFIDQNLLYLIPFYDYYTLKFDLEERYKIKCEKLVKSQALQAYNYILKKILEQ